MSGDKTTGLFERLARLKGETTVDVPVDAPAVPETLEPVPVEPEPLAPEVQQTPDDETQTMTLSKVVVEDPCECVDNDEDDDGGVVDVPCADPVAVGGTALDDDITLPNAGIVTAGAGDDVVLGSTCDDTISGEAGNDMIDGGRDDDFIVGGAGSDVLMGSGGDDTLIGGGGTAADHIVTLTFEGAETDFLNTIGVYIIDPCGEIQSVRLAFENAQSGTKGDLEPGTSTFSFSVPPYAKVGVFLVANGFAVNDGFAGLGEGEFAFVNDAGDPAMITDTAPKLVHINADGVQTPIEGDVYHSAGFGENLALNPDKEVHLRGISENDDGTFNFAFEDMPNTGTSDFDDVQFSVNMGNSGAHFVNPDYDANGDLVGGGDESNFLYGGSGDDYIVSGDAGDVIYGGSGDDTVYAGPGDTIDGGSGHDILVVKDPSNFKSITITKTVVDADGKESFNGFINYKDTDETTDFVCIEKIIPCFTPGTSIATPKGERLVEELRDGDKIITRDNGIQEIRWIGKRPLDWAGLAANPHLKPVLIEKGALGNGLPERDILVSPQHRFLVVNERTQLYFDEHEVLVAAKHLINHRQIRQIDSMGLTYVHFMCDRHQVVLANGAWTETFQPGDYTLGGMGNAQRLELFELFPDLATKEGRDDYASARKTLKKHEARLIAS